MRYSRRPFIFAAAVVNVLAIGGLLLMLWSEFDVSQFDKNAPIGLVVFQVALFVVAVLLAGVAGRAYYKRPLPFFVYGLIPALVAIAYLLGRYGDIFETSTACPVIKMAEYPKFLIDNIARGVAEKLWLRFKPEWFTVCPVRQSGFTETLIWGVQVFAWGIVLWTVWELIASITRRKPASENGTRAQGRFPEGFVTPPHLRILAIVLAVGFVAGALVLEVSMLSIDARWVYVKWCSEGYGLQCLIPMYVLAFFTVAPFLAVIMAYELYELIVERPKRAASER